jgi:hypothetical protein
MGYAKKVDANQLQIVEYARSLGASVQHLHGVGRGVPDLVIGYKGKNYLAEVKGLKGKLNELQVKWFTEWSGQAQVVKNKEDIDTLLGLK